MRNFQRRPKAFRPNKLFEKRAQLREQALAIESERLSKVETLKTDPLEFFRQVLGVEPTDYQKELINSFQENQFIAARWSRQSGKSFTTSGILLNYALANPNFYIGVVGPSWRQTKLVIRRIGDFARRLPPRSKILVQKTKITTRTGQLLRLSQTILTLSEVQHFIVFMLTNSTSSQTPKTSMMPRSSRLALRMGSLSAPVHPGTQTAYSGEFATIKILRILQDTTSLGNEPRNPMVR